MPAAYPRSLPLEFCWGLTIGMQAADFQDSKRRLQPLRLEDRQNGDASLTTRGKGWSLRLACPTWV